MNHIPVIALSGGPCAGKSTAITHLQQRLSDYGFTVITIAEAATEFILAGLKPGENLLTSEDFQDQLIAYALAKEDIIKHAAGLLRAKKAVILCDRGLPDGAAYLPRRQFEKLLRKHHQTMVEARDGRYDGVIFLHSLAVDKPELYTLANNTARTETVQQARQLNQRTLRAWTGHPHLRQIGNEADWDGKLNQILRATCRVLGIPAPLEIERKFKVVGFNPKLIPHAVRVHIIQHYLRTAQSGLLEERIRARGQGKNYLYFHTQKQELRKGVRLEHERQITHDEYLEYRQRLDPVYATIEKMRYCFPYHGQYFEFDHYIAPLGFDILEIELTDENDVVTLPNFLKGKAEEVTGNSDYSNKSIARQLAKSA